MRIFILALLLVSLPVYAKKLPTHTIWLYNETTNETIVDTNTAEIRPIASLTKLMTAMVTLDISKNLNTQYRLSNKVGSKLPIRSYTKRDLLTALLVKSDNAAAETLAENYPGGRYEFIRAMNNKAKLLGMNATTFVDPSGLDLGNRSTANDVSKMIVSASKYELIASTTVKKDATVDVPYKKKVKELKISNTNKRLLLEINNVVTSKTGFTNAAGFCLSMIVEKDQQKYIVVILGAKSQSQRTDIAKQLIYKI